MTVLGIDPALLQELVSAVSGRQVRPDEVEERFASSAWTTIAEPGDRHAGGIVAVLGALEALSLVSTGVSGDVLSRRLREAGATDVPPPAELQDAVDRLAPRVSARALLLALKQAARFHVRLLVPTDSLWPAGLGDLGPFGPLALWTRGTDAALASMSKGYWYMAVYKYAE